jgi:hypothetical protein
VVAGARGRRWLGRLRRQVAQDGRKFPARTRGQRALDPVSVLVKAQSADGGVPLQGLHHLLTVLVRGSQLGRIHIHHLRADLPPRQRVGGFSGTVHGVAPSTPGNGLFVIERILRDRASIWQQIVDERDLRQLIGQMVASTVISLALYGAVLGASHGWQQILSSMVKLPLLFLATLAICLPTLYLFNLVFGSRLSMVQAVALIMVSITVTAVLTLAFAPVSLFFLVTAKSYSFYKLLNVSILLLTALVGLRFLVEGMRAVNDQRSVTPVEATVEIAMVPETVNGSVPPQVRRMTAATADGAPVAIATLPPATATVPPMQASPQGQTRAVGMQPAQVGQSAAARPASTILLYVWIVLFGFVGTQLAWTLRPFFGDPGSPFAVFREVGGTFYADVFSTIGQLLGG